MRLATVIGLAALSAPALADAPPKALFGAYGGWDDANCSRNDDEVWTCAPPKAFSGAVVAPAGDKIRVWMSFWGASSGCEFDGLGAWDGKQLVAQSTAAQGDQVCRVTVTFDGEKASTAGDPNACDCGGWINTTGLPRISADATIPPVETAAGDGAR
ncbi:hypothetical protein [Methylopila sp. M107]|uniref:hypothetical protein n=1 Tax=Methylopila sp. M107 TaxID=1101190 RepID=UPI0012DE6996|nr:hypothetical protein [Methylopila sp. M107]